MNKKINKIFSLSKILLKDSIQNFNIFDKDVKKINKKNPIFWLLLIVIIAVSYISYEIIDGLNSIKQVEIFLYIFPLFLFMLFLFQTILNSINLYFFSNDLELILPMPFKADEILISKFITITVNMYFSEFIFALFPLIIYGIFTFSSMAYYIYLMLFLLIFPIFPVLIVSIFVMLFVKISRVIKNKDIFQIVLTLIFLFFVFVLEFKLTNNIVSKEMIGEIEATQAEELVNKFYTRIENINKYLIIINPSINMLKKLNFISILEFFKILIINIFLFLILIFLGNKFYIENILKCNAFYKIKKINKINYEKKCKKKSKGKSYIIKELKTLLKNPTYFIQCIYPSLIIMASIAIIVIKTLPNLREFFASNMMEEFGEINIDFYFISIILVITQVVFAISNIAITSISRDGKNAIFMKYIPISLYKQYIYKMVPQFLMNLINIVFVIILEKILFVDTPILILVYIFIITNLLNIINCMILVIIDFINPKLNWDAEYQAIKQNNNKIYQYVMSIIIILILLYFSKILSNMNLNMACSIIILILLIIIIFVNILVKKNVVKLYKKIK